ncbi:MAG: aldose 1-epimerase family protein [Candidatus Dormibacteraeota bacterium]|nr:aldose 1-epimerase family protein [Candidatus Dormibacteraeota bacterium]
MAMVRSLHPSGEQYEIFFGDQRAVITEVGATLREYWSGGRAVLDGFAVSEMCSGGRGQLLMPWPNRIRDGAYNAGGQRLQLPINEPERGNAIHGLVRWPSWLPVEHTHDRIHLSHTLRPQPGYPFLLQLAADYALGPEGLRTTWSAHNLGDEPAPFGAGSHPYLRPLAGLVDRAELRIPARSYLEVDERMNPTGRRLPVASTPYDFRTRRQVAGGVLDVCYADFDEPVLEFDGLRLAWDGNHHFLQVFSGDALEPERRRRGLGAEPMTCPANAFNSGEGLVMLPPGHYRSGSWSISLLN